MSKSLASRRGQPFGTAKCFVFFILSYQTLSTVYSEAVVAKCCPLGQVLSVSENFSCAYPTNSTRELYPLKRAPNKDFLCDVTANLTATFLDDIVASEQVIQATTSCLDFLYDSENIPVILQCKPNNNEQSNYDGAIDSLPVPRVSNIRICCSPGLTYDVEIKECVPRISELNVPQYFRAFDKSHDFLTVQRGTPSCEYAVIDYVVNVTENVPRVLDNGNFEIVVSTKNGFNKITATENNSCVDTGDEFPDLMALRMCSDATYCKKNACVRKCCPEGEATVDNSCAKIPLNMPAMNLHNALLNTSRERGYAESAEYLNASDYGLLIGKPCQTRERYHIYKDDNWHMTPQGGIFVPGYRLYDHENYCAEIIYTQSTFEVEYLPSVCFESPIQEDQRLTRFLINAVLELISSGFLTATLLVYICLPALQNLHGKTVMCHVSSLIVAYLTIAAVALELSDRLANSETSAKNICQFFGFSVLASWMAAFSWLNIMCFDIWWTFGGLGRAAVSGARGRAYKKRFVIYSLYAWGMPLLITSLSVVAEKTELVPHNFRPNIGNQSCWFEGRPSYYGKIVFFIAPVSLQLVTNVAFFVLTAMHCSRVKAEISRVMSSPTDSRNRRFRSDRTKLIMNVKLFIVMGISWTLEVISSMLDRYVEASNWHIVFFYVPDAFNCLQGVAIFTLFALKKKVYHALRRRLGLRGSNGTADNATQGLQDPFKVRKSVSSSTIMSTFGVSTSPPSKISQSVL